LLKGPQKDIDEVSEIFQKEVTGSFEVENSEKAI
jgi:hypothetical protein